MKHVLATNFLIGWMGCCFVSGVWADGPTDSTEVAVRTGTITLATLQRYVQAYGLAEPEPARHGKPAASAKVAAPVAGIISQVHCQEGQAVRQGDLLFSLDSRAVQGQIAKAQVAVAFAEKNISRKQQLKLGESISRKLVDDAQQLLETARADLQAAQTQADLLAITAPLSGTVTALHFKVGEAITPSSVLADVLALHRLAITLHVPSEEAADLRLGQTVSIGLRDPQYPPTGLISYISPQIDPMTDTVLVRVTPSANLCPQKPCLLAGQFVHARIMVEQRRNRLTVPIASVVKTENSATLAIVDGDYAKQQPVTTGLQEGDVIEVSGTGLQAGMTVVTEGAYGLPPETRIRVLK